MKTIARLEGLGQSFWVVAGLLTLAGLGVLDLVTGYEYSVSLFYLLPISMVAWFVGARSGLAASILSAIVWLLADIGSGHHYSQAIIVVWNAFIRLGFFVVVAVLLGELAALLKHERALARTDYVTGAASAGYFYVVLQSEIDRSARYGRPFTLVYVDVDDFKAVNDKFGHNTGDQALASVVLRMKNRLRKSDTVGRLGGDEFAILLPETDQGSAPGVLSSIRKDLLEEMRKRNLDATFSIGSITFVAAPATTDEAIKLVDELMYQVKRAGKNAIKHEVYEGQPIATR